MSPRERFVDRGEQEPVVTKSESSVAETTETHPAMGQIRLGRWQGSGNRMFGSDFLHRVGITVTISRAERNRSLSNDWYHGREEIISIDLTEAQWATLVSSVGVGEGVPCTILHVEGKQKPRIAAPKESRVKQFGDEMKRRFDGIRETIGNLRQRITEGKGGKESLKLLDSIEQAAVSNSTFTAEQFDRHMEKTVEKAKVEIHAYGNRLGLKAGPAPLSLDEKYRDGFGN